MDSGDTKLKKHFETGKKNTTYRSKTIQNKLVKICGTQIRVKIVSEINNSNCPVYLVLADEATDCSSIELIISQLSCVMWILAKKLTTGLLNLHNVKG